MAFGVVDGDGQPVRVVVLVYEIEHERMRSPISEPKRHTVSLTTYAILLEWQRTRRCSRRFCDRSAEGMRPFGSILRDGGDLYSNRFRVQVLGLVIESEFVQQVGDLPGHAA